MKHLLICCVAALCLPKGRAQSGADYFQQEVHHRIEVRLDDQLHRLEGRQQITYVNHSPDTLREIYMHLWPNAYRTVHSAFAKQQLRNRQDEFFFATPEERGGYEHIAFMTEGDTLRWHYVEPHPDIALLSLPRPLAPGDSIVIHSTWLLQLPRVFSRLGHEGQSYMITQWYPKPAVYDREGWHPMPYLDMGEFYSEFGDFDVRITLPRNYVVAATGTLQTPEEVRFLRKRMELTEAKVDGALPLSDAVPPSDSVMKTVRFTATGVHDFAWFADKRFNVRMKEVTLPSGKKVTAAAYFLDSGIETWKRAHEFVGRTLQFYSDKVGTYPWPHATAVQGPLDAGGGMEYPMITVLDWSIEEPEELDRIIAHEVGHNWFYGILATNERMHAWMDEGINSYYEGRYMRQYYGRTDEALVLELFRRHSRMSENELIWLALVRAALDLPPDMDAWRQTQSAYLVGAYVKPPLALRQLEALVGADRLDAAVQAYFDQWKFRHPGPADFRRSLEQALGLELDWLVGGYFRSNQTVDYSLRKLRRKGAALELTIANRGRVAAPFPLALYRDTTLLQTHWFDGFTGRQTLTLPLAAGATRVVLDPDHATLDLYRHDNAMRISGLLRKARPLRPVLLWQLESDKYGLVNALPVLSWDRYDGLMPGLLLYNNIVPHRRWEWQLVPQWSVRQGELVGMARLQRHWWWRSGPVRQLTLGWSGRTYHYFDNPAWSYTLRYARQGVFLRLAFRQMQPTSFRHQLEASWRWIHEEQARFDTLGSFTGKELAQRPVARLLWKGRNERPVNPWQMQAGLEGSRLDYFGQQHRYVRLWLEGRFAYTYDSGRHISARFFVGGFLHNTAARRGFILPGAWNLTAQGFNDYAYDRFFAGRYEGDGIWLRQIALAEGGMKVALGPAYLQGQSNRLVVALNLEADLPKDLPLGLGLKPYFDIGYFEGAGIFQPDDWRDNLWWQGGVALNLFGKQLRLFLPLVNSDNLEFLYDQSGRSRLWSRLVWTVPFESYDPWRIRERLLDR